MGFPWVHNDDNKCISNVPTPCMIHVWGSKHCTWSQKLYNNTRPDLIMHAMAHSILHTSLHPLTHAQEQKPISVRSFKRDYDFYPCITDMNMKTTFKITSAFLFLDCIVTNKWCILCGFYYYVCIVIICLFKWCLYGIMGYLMGCSIACKRFCR